MCYFIFVNNRLCHVSLRVKFTTIYCKFKLRVYVSQEILLNYVFFSVVFVPGIFGVFLFKKMPSHFHAINPKRKYWKEKACKGKDEYE